MLGTAFMVVALLLFALVGAETPLVTTLQLPELPLRTVSGLQARAEEGRDPSGIPSDVAVGPGS